MYNLHSHSILSDGVLLPSEIARRYEAAGYKAIAITDHVDYSNIEFVVSSVKAFTRKWPGDSGIKILTGVELTHLPLEQFKPLVKYARKKGIQVIIGHGESPVEPVIKGTNRAAIEAGVDILAHPGDISDIDATLAAKKGIFLELTSRNGHSDGNAHVAQTALRTGAKLILSHDAHAPKDIISPGELEGIALNAGLSRADIDKIYRNVGGFIKNRRIRR